MSKVTARLAGRYPTLPDAAGFPAHYQRDLELEVLDRDPNNPAVEDAITVAFQRHQVWEPHETLLAVDILTHCPGLVLDFGAHVGWYSILARAFGNHPEIGRAHV